MNVLICCWCEFGLELPVGVLEDGAGLKGSRSTWQTCLEAKFFFGADDNSTEISKGIFVDMNVNPTKIKTLDIKLLLSVSQINVY